MNLAIIPARGGSKRIPKKNIKPFLGKPILAYSIETAKASGLFDKIVVSTDSQEIADIALKYGAEIPFLRPKDLSDDYSPTIPVLLHAENWFLTQKIKLEFCCCLYPANPLLSIAYLKEGLRSLKEQKNKFSAISVVAYAHPVFRSFIIKDACIEMLWPENYNKRSQDFPRVYHDAAQFYWWRSGYLKENSIFFNADAVPIILPESLVQDIDCFEDWKLAELKYQILTRQER